MCQPAGVKQVTSKMLRHFCKTVNPLNIFLENFFMHTPAHWLTLVAMGYRAKNKSQLARLISVSRSSISQQKTGSFALSTKTAVKVADLLGVSPMLVIASSMHHQATTDEDRDFWAAIYKFWDDQEDKSPVKQFFNVKRGCIYKPPTGWEDPQ